MTGPSCLSILFSKSPVTALWVTPTQECPRKDRALGHHTNFSPFPYCHILSLESLLSCHHTKQYLIQIRPNLFPLAPGKDNFWGSPKLPRRSFLSLIRMWVKLRFPSYIWVIISQLPRSKDPRTRGNKNLAFLLSIIY